MSDKGKDFTLSSKQSRLAEQLIKLERAYLNYAKAYRIEYSCSDQELKGIVLARLSDEDLVEDNPLLKVARETLETERKKTRAAVDFFEGTEQDKQLTFSSLDEDARGLALDALLPKRTEILSHEPPQAELPSNVDTSFAARLEKRNQEKGQNRT